MKWTHRILIGLVVLAGLIAALWWEENWRGQKIWEESCARLRAAGEPVEIADIIPPEIPDEENVAAAPIFAEVFAASDASGTRLGRISVGWKSVASKRLERFPASRPISPTDLTFLNYWAQSLRRSFPATAPHGPFRNPTDEVVTYYAQLHEEWQGIDDALRRPRCRWPLAYEDGLEMAAPHLLYFMSLADTSRGWVAALAASGDSEAYSELLLSLLELERCVGERPTTLISHLVALTMCATTLLAWQNSLPLIKLSDGQLLRLQSQLEQLSLSDAVTAFRSDRVILLHACSKASAHDLVSSLEVAGLMPRRWDSWSWVRRAEDTVFESIILARPHGWQLADIATFQDALQSIGAGCIDEKRQVILKSEVDGMSTKADRLVEKLGWYTFSRHMLGESISTQQKILIRTANLHATARCAIVWCAAERFRLKHGHLPQSQDLLVPEFLSAPKLDPIDGRPLQFVTKGKDGLLVYSVGWDGKDGGGVRGRKSGDGDFGWASDPMQLANPDEIHGWKEEDNERAEIEQTSLPKKRISKTKMPPVVTPP